VLSEREKQILQLLVEGATTSEIAASLSLAKSTINTYRSRMLRKLKMGEVASLVKFALRHGLTDLV
jgi:DNA-binding NarL/FixJ family response regulator